MRIHATHPLFAWAQLDDSPSIALIRTILELIPDQNLLAQLHAARKHGRNDYPVRVCWAVVLLRVILRHQSFDACLAELHRNTELRQLIGIESIEAIPKSYNISRFLKLLGLPAHLEELRAIFNHLIRTLGGVVEDLGQHTAADSTMLNARASRAREQAAAAGDATPMLTGLEKALARQAKADGEDDHAPVDKVARDAHGLPLPAGGSKSYTDDQGVVTRVVTWFGYKLHLIADTRHEVALAYQSSSTKTGDNEVLPDLVEQARANLPEGRIETLAYDKAADDHGSHACLHRAGIKPLIQNRSLWSDQEPERRLPGHGADSNLVHDEAGTVFCYDMVSDPPVRRPMAYIGHEAARGTLKYRCPARHAGLPCPSEAKCNEGRTYGLTVRVKQEKDLRRFPAIPRATKQFERLYKGRSSIERVNARLKLFWGIDDGNVAGAGRFHALVGVVMLAHAAFATVLATAPRWEGTLSRTSITPIAQALSQQLKLTG